MKNSPSAYPLALLILVFTGCGYHVGEIKPTPMRRINTIAINTFRNETLLPRVEVQTANAVIKQFQQDGTYRMESADRADAVIQGTIVSVDRQPMRVFANNVLQTSEFQLVLVVRYRVLDRVTGAILQQGTARGTTPFFTESDRVNSDLVTNQNMNYPIAAQRMAESLVSKVAEGW